MNDYIKSKWTYGLIWLVVIAIIIWIIAGTSKNDQEKEILVNQETYTMEVQERDSSEQTAETVSGYYLVRAENEMVKVYWIDESGEHLYRETTIAYTLLSAADQKILDEGVKLETDEDLAGFLENYDS